MKIGRKIYYEINTGNVIIDTGERQGDVVETTTDQDFQLYKALQNYQTNAVGVLQLVFGQDATNFASYPIHVDPTAKRIVWDTANPIGASLGEVKAAKKAQLDDLCTQAIMAGFQSSALGTAHTYESDADAITKLPLVIKRLELNPDTTATLPYFTVDAGFIPHNLSQLHQVFCEGMDASMQFQQKKVGLYAQVEAATTIDEVHAIAW